MPCVAGRGRRMQKQFGSGRGIITTEFRIEVAVSTNVDTGLEWLAVRAGPLGHLEHDRRAARQRPCGFLGSGAMHLLVGVGVPVRERYGSGIVDLPHASLSVMRLSVISAWEAAILYAAESRSLEET